MRRQWWSLKNPVSSFCAETWHDRHEFDSQNGQLFIDFSLKCTKTLLKMWTTILLSLSSVVSIIANSFSFFVVLWEILVFSAELKKGNPLLKKKTIFFMFHVYMLISFIRIEFNFSRSIIYYNFLSIVEQIPRKDSQ